MEGARKRFSKQVAKGPTRMESRAYRTNCFLIKFEEIDEMNLQMANEIAVGDFCRV